MWNKIKVGLYKHYMFIEDASVGFLFTHPAPELVPPLAKIVASKDIEGFVVDDAEDVELSMAHPTNSGIGCWKRSSRGYGSDSQGSSCYCSCHG